MFGEYTRRPCVMCLCVSFAGWWCVALCCAQGKRREISLDEFTSGLRSIGFKATENDARALFDKLDVNHDGIINYLDWDDYLAVEELYVLIFPSSCYVLITPPACSC